MSARPGPGPIVRGPIAVDPDIFRYLRAVLKGRLGGRIEPRGAAFDALARTLSGELENRFARDPARSETREAIRQEVRSIIEADLGAWIDDHYRSYLGDRLVTLTGDRVDPIGRSSETLRLESRAALKTRFGLHPSRFGDDQAIRREVDGAVRDALFDGITVQSIPYLDEYLASQLGDRAGKKGWEFPDVAQECWIELRVRFARDSSWYGDFEATRKQIRFVIGHVLSDTKERTENLQGRLRDGMLNFEEPGWYEAWIAVQTSVSSRVERRSREAALESEMAKLPPGSGTAIDRYHLGGKTLEEVSKSLGLSRDKVWHKIRAGLKRLRLGLARFDPDRGGPAREARS